MNGTSSRAKDGAFSAMNALRTEVRLALNDGQITQDLIPARLRNIPARLRNESCGIKRKLRN